MKCDSDMENIVPTEFQLAQNYPNPFRERTTIKYCVPEKMKIRLEVFDVDGNKLETLIDTVHEPGTYKIDFNSNKLENGEYLYKLESENYFETKKMVLMK
jgi:hypothetical protein